MWFKKIMVRFFIGLDSILFNFIGTLYNLLISISRTSILTQGEIQSFATRVEILLGIFMLFKLSFSLLTYIINPDNFSDSSKGFGKLIQNSVLSLAMLILVPYAFQMAFNLQAKILDDNLLAKLILGEKITAGGTDDTNETIIDSAGDLMAFEVMLPFFTPKYSVLELSDCVNMYGDNGQFNDVCYEALINAGMNEIALTNYSKGIENKSLGLTFRETTALQTIENENNEEVDFIIDYKYFLSTVTAVIVCLLLITFCIDIGLRSVKLAFLQIIYPIPVISFMDPASGKDGIFKKWYKMCFSTFLSLFLRLAALYFGIYIIVKVADLGMYDIINGSQVANFWVQIFVIIGILMFIKQMPKILEGLGVKLDGGDFSLNPLKKIEKNALGGKILSRVPKATAGAALGLGMGAVGAATGAGIGKGISGMIGGAVSGLKGKKIGEIHKGQIDSNQRMREAISNGSTFWGRKGAQLSGLVGSQGRAGKLSAQDKELENQIKQKQEFHDSFDNVKSKISSAIEGNKLGSYSEKYTELKAKAEAARIRRDSINKNDMAYYDNIERTNADGSKRVEKVFNEERYNSAIDAAANDVVKAEGAVTKYLKKDAVEDFYKAYRNGALSDSEKDSDVLRAFDNLDVQARANNIDESILQNYASIKEKDNDFANDINKLQGDRVKIREAKAKTAADKSAFGK